MIWLGLLMWALFLLIVLIWLLRSMPGGLTTEQIELTYGSIRPYRHRYMKALASQALQNKEDAEQQSRLERKSELLARHRRREHTLEPISGTEAVPV